MNIQVLIINVGAGTGEDVSDLVSRVVCSGRKSSPVRTLEVTLLDDENGTRANIDVENGLHCVFYLDGTEQFRGIILKQKNTSKKQVSFTAYDNGIYFVNNKDSFTYKNSTASQIFVDICKRFEIPYEEPDDTEFVIADLPESKTSLHDVVGDALDLTYEATSVRFFPWCVGEKMCLIRRRDNILQWVIEPGVNMLSYNFDKSVYDIKNKIKVVSDDGTIAAEAVSEDWKKKLGGFQEIESVSGFTEAQMHELANQILDENTKPKETISLTAIGIPEVKTGIGIYIIIPSLGIGKTYYVEEDKHTYEKGQHKMDLKLCSAKDIDSSAASNGESDATNLENVMRTAAAEVGTTEYPKGSNTVKYNTEYYGEVVSGACYQWCCVFLWWVFNHAGCKTLFYGGNKCAWCQSLVTYYEQQGRLVDDYQPGDLFFLWSSKDMRASHVGLIASVSDDYIYTIEGNHDSKVDRVERKKSSIWRVARPAY